MQYGFGEELTKENILKKISSYDIFKYYSENFVEIGKSFNSDFRQEKNPSCQISQIHGDLMYSDFGLGKSFRCFSFIMELYHISYFDALNKVNLDFNLGLGNYIPEGRLLKKQPILGDKIQLKEKLPSVLKKRQRPFTEKDLKYWSDFYWTEWMLKESNTQSISNYWVNGYQFDVKPDELAFSYEYYWHNDRMQRKFYFPERTKFKWFSNVDNTICQLVNVAPKTGDVLFITSSKKDGGIFWRIELEKMFPNLIIHGVAPNTEGAFVPDKWFYKMQTRWKRIVIWYNNDWHKVENPGVMNAKKYAEQYGIEYYYNPDNEPKDPSDFAKKYSLVEFRNLIQDKLKI